MRTLRIRSARDELLRITEEAGLLQLVERIMFGGGRPLLCAGAVRDVLRTVEHGCELAPRDLDLAVAEFSREAFDSLFQSLGARPNSYGGYTLASHGLKTVDVWRANESCGLVSSGVGYSLDAMLRSFVIDANAVAFDYRTSRIHEVGALFAINARKISLVDGALLHSESTFAAKALLCSARFRYETSSTLQSFCRAHLESTRFAYEASKLSARIGLHELLTETYAAASDSPIHPRFSVLPNDDQTHD